MSESAENFSAVLIEAKDSGGTYTSVYISDPNNKIISINTIKYTNSTWFGINSRVVKISDTQITTNVAEGNRTTGQINVINGSATRTGVISITKVVGFK